MKNEELIGNIEDELNIVRAHLHQVGTLLVALSINLEADDVEYLRLQRYPVLMKEYSTV